MCNKSSILNLAVSSTTASTFDLLSLAFVLSSISSPPSSEHRRVGTKRKFLRRHFARHHSVKPSGESSRRQRWHRTSVVATLVDPRPVADVSRSSAASLADRRQDARLLGQVFRQQQLAGADHQPTFSPTTPSLSFRRGRCLWGVWSCPYFAPDLDTELGNLTGIK